MLLGQRHNETMELSLGVSVNKSKIGAIPVDDSKAVTVVMVEHGLEGVGMEPAVALVEEGMDRLDGLKNR